MSSASAYKHDATSTASYNEPDESLKKANDEVRHQIIGKARAKLIESLDSLTPEKLNGSKARDLAGIAKDMSTLINNVEPQSGDINNNVKFVFHVPATKKEQDFEVIDVT